MVVEEFTYEDLGTGWSTTGAEFAPFTLLVGATGAGKTLVVEAIRSAARSADGGRPPHARWAMTFREGGRRYVWSARTCLSGGDGRASFAAESLAVLGGAPIFERSASGASALAGTEVPLDRAISAVRGLRGEPEVVAAAAALRRFSFCAPGGFREVERWAEPTLGDLQGMVNAARGGAAIEGDLAVRLFVLCRARPHEFIDLLRRLRDVFPFVEDLRTVPHPCAAATVEAREPSGLWVPQSRMSRGVLRTLGYLCEFATAREGTVVVLDDLDGLGPDCMPAVVEAARSRPDCQVVVSSHDPWVINNVPMDEWRIVSRRGAEVRVRRAADVPSLAGTSHHDPFLRLLNSDEFSRGVR